MLCVFPFLYIYMKCEKRVIRYRIIFQKNMKRRAWWDGGFGQRREKLASIWKITIEAINL